MLELESELGLMLGFRVKGKVLGLSLLREKIDRTFPLPFFSNDGDAFLSEAFDIIVKTRSEQIPRRMWLSMVTKPMFVCRNICKVRVRVRGRLRVRVKVRVGVRVTGKG